ncbi:uncharacterized protein LOC105767066 [Gossypium raimondii]|uniref:uncharacterized protein LOC105767066 n=1 Tax=Gossypium raimondii TaxID=29730 RepID=UPI00227BEB05|nr:uncharacterized protein LOC105767066 [Gossypium raimondii]
MLKETRKRLDFLYAREESYWAQRSRSRWLREGDQNTRFFHAKASGRLKKNYIEKLKDAAGNWVTKSKDISMVAKDYFASLFRSNGQNANIQEMGYIRECMTREANEWLNMAYTESEVLQAIKQMDPNKAPRIDGLSGNFFKHHWEIVGKDTIKFCMDVLNGNKNISCLNDTMIILIPKTRDPCELTNFRPISLYRHVYKIIAKVNKTRDMESLANMLSIFSNISGQEISFDKSMVFFSPNTSRDQRTILSGILGMTVVEKLNNYLGLPIPIGKKKTTAFQEITNRLSYRMNSWTKRLLSYGGKEVFIKTAKLSRTWWAGKEKGGFWTMVPWKTLCKPKAMGGLAIRDIRLFNLALLRRQVDKASFTWSSIATAAEALKVSFGWQIGNGEKINIRADNWGLEGLNRDAILSNTLNHNEKSVKVLWHADCRRWNVNKVKQVYGHDWGDKIYDIPIRNENQEDKMIWFHNPHGCFTSKSAYSWLLLKEMGFGPHRYFWKAYGSLTLYRRSVFFHGGWVMKFSLRIVRSPQSDRDLTRGAKDVELSPKRCYMC